MKLYHGTSDKISKELISGKIDTKIGSGEFGQGFYSGDLMFRALNWAKHKYNKNLSVVEFTLDDKDFENLDPLCLNKLEAIKYRDLIKKKNQTQDYKFNKNAIWGPVVGKEFENYEQVKFESPKSESYLNSDKVNRIKIK